MKSWHDVRAIPMGHDPNARLRSNGRGESHAIIRNQQTAGSREPETSPTTIRKGPTLHQRRTATRPGDESEPNTVTSHIMTSNQERVARYQNHVKTVTQLPRAPGKTCVPIPLVQQSRTLFSPNPLAGFRAGPLPSCTPLLHATLHVTHSYCTSTPSISSSLIPLSKHSVLLLAGKELKLRGRAV